MTHENKDERSERGQMTVSEAGHRGGEKGGQRVRELIREGEEKESERW